jgi:NitT/TauT family transport system substrate-binding protein
MGFDYPEDGLYVSETFYRENTQQCLKFAEASRKGWEWVRNNRKEALEIVMKYVKAENVPTNIYNQRVMLDTILEAQEDVKGGTPSYKLKVEDFNRLNEILKRFRYTSVPVEYERFIGE